MMHNHFETHLPYFGLALFVLAVFYGIYFIKMLSQKKRGIHTNQVSLQKEKRQRRTEIAMLIATCSAVVAQLLSMIFNINYMPAGARFTGFLLGLMGDGIFLIAVLCMKDNWRVGIPSQDKTSVVRKGIYAWSRNPAFLGFDFMYIGIFFMYGNLLTGVFSIFSIIMLHLQILQEEKYMAKTFGQEYLAYKKRIFRYMGRKR